jgi:hypothetical protein
MRHKRHYAVARSIEHGVEQRVKKVEHTANCVLCVHGDEGVDSLQFSLTDKPRASGTVVHGCTSPHGKNEASKQWSAASYKSIGTDNSMEWLNTFFSSVIFQQGHYCFSFSVFGQLPRSNADKLSEAANLYSEGSSAPRVPCKKNCQPFHWPV